MNHSIGLLLLIFGVTGYYTYFGQMVPQKEVHPPKTLELTASMTTDEMIAAGKTIFSGKGTCVNCHKMSGGTGRFPDLGTIGARAGSQESGLNDIEYLAKALYKPNAFIVKGFSPGMPVINKPPVGLTDMEMKAMIAYLQSLGGTATITMATKLKYEGTAGAAAEEEPAKVYPKIDFKSLSQSSPKYIAEGKALFVSCAGCHGDDGKGDGIAGKAMKPKPRNFTSLEGWTNGAKLTEIYKTLEEGIAAKGMPSVNYLEPDKRLKLIHYIRSLAPGYPEDSADELKALDAKYKLGGGKFASSGGEKSSSASGGGKALLTKHACVSCHAIDTPDKLLGPSLMAVGKTQSKKEILESIMNPDAKLVEGFPPGLMKATLEGMGFYKNASKADIQKMVDFLAGQKGK